MRWRDGAAARAYIEHVFHARDLRDVPRADGLIEGSLTDSEEGGAPRDLRHVRHGARVPRRDVTVRHLRARRVAAPLGERALQAALVGKRAPRRRRGRWWCKRWRGRRRWRRCDPELHLGQVALESCLVVSIGIRGDFHLPARSCDRRSEGSVRKAFVPVRGSIAVHNSVVRLRSLDQRHGPACRLCVQAHLAEGIPTMPRDAPVSKGVRGSHLDSVRVGQGLRVRSRKVERLSKWICSCAIDWGSDRAMAVMTGVRYER